MLEVGNAVVLLATEPHRTAILQKLRRDSIDVDAVLKQGRYILLDAGETLSKIMVAGLPDPVLCATLVGEVVTESGQKPQRENISALQFAENVRLHCWQRVMQRRRFDSNTSGMKSPGRYDADTLCGYLWNAVPRQESSAIFERICAEHSAVQGCALGYYGLFRVYGFKAARICGPEREAAAGGSICPALAGYAGTRRVKSSPTRIYMSRQFDRPPKGSIRRSWRSSEIRRRCPMSGQAYPTALNFGLRFPL